jgi:hypothetical protein
MRFAKQLKTMKQDRDVLDIISMYQHNTFYDKPLPPVPDEIDQLSISVLRRQHWRTWIELQFQSRPNGSPGYTRNQNFHAPQEVKNKRRRGVIFIDGGRGTRI